MDSRGRSRDVSPAALARVIARDPAVPALAYCSPSPPPTPPSVSPTDSVIIRTNSSSTLSVSPDATLLTPPEYDGCDRKHVSLDYYDSPPSPPRTLQDQMQHAYALDNMHLAKILLLKLQGIEVTSDDDPRIAQVKDADFSSAFVPPGGLQLEEEAERRWREGMRREEERKKRRRREERLRACERVWEGSLRCLREERYRSARRREDDARERRRTEIEARGREREAREHERERDLRARYTRQLKTCSAPQRAKLSYGALPAAPTRVMSSRPTPPLSPSCAQFEYAMMPASTTFYHRSPASSSPPKKSPLSSPHPAFKELSALSARNVTFSSVLVSMHGPLFPEDADEEEDGTPGSAGSGTSVKRVSTSRGRCHRRTPSQMLLLDELLKRHTGKWEERPRTTTTRTVMPTPRRKACLACSLGSSPTPSTSTSTSTQSVSTTSTTRSWFSFGKSIPSSISTLLTTPSSSLGSPPDEEAKIDTLPSPPIELPALSPASISIHSPSSSSSATTTTTTATTDPHTCTHFSPRRRSSSPSPSPARLTPLAPGEKHPLSPEPIAKGVYAISLSGTTTTTGEGVRRGRGVMRSSSGLTTPASTSTSTSASTPASTQPTPRAVKDLSGEQEGEGLLSHFAITHGFGSSISIGSGIGKSVSKLVDLATQFQRAYVKATLFSVGAVGVGGYDEWEEWEERSYERSQSGERYRDRRRRGDGQEVQRGGEREERREERGRRRYRLEGYSSESEGRRRSGESEGRRRSEESEGKGARRQLRKEGWRVEKRDLLVFLGGLDQDSSSAFSSSASSSSSSTSTSSTSASVSNATSGDTTRGNSAGTTGGKTKVSAPTRALLPLATFSYTTSSSTSSSSTSSSHPTPPPVITQRYRPIANPLALRVRAAQNCLRLVGGGAGREKSSLLVGSGGGGGGGDVSARGSGSGGSANLPMPTPEVKEKVVGVAWDGIGRSSLGWEGFAFLKSTARGLPSTPSSHLWSILIWTIHSRDIPSSYRTSTSFRSPLAVRNRVSLELRSTVPTRPPTQPTTHYPLSRLLFSPPAALSTHLLLSQPNSWSEPYLDIRLLATPLLLDPQHPRHPLEPEQPRHITPRDS
ncbi:hypothetical protein K474DRAFT_1672173 [Panus rudis PR-1116 ss-1]|nr:hypothetical protein K474DRAFT_1672173 [Panus rudis PR-1116 ss-1]